MRNSQASALVRLIELGKRFVNDPSDERYAQYQRQLTLVKSLQRLPAATYTRLFGVENTAESLGTQLLEPRGAVHQVQGLPGIGKTALANYVITHKLNADTQSLPNAIYWITIEHRGAAVWEKTPTPNIDPQVVYRQMGRALRLPKFDTLPNRLQQEQIAETITDRRYIFVIDNFQSAAEPLALMPMLNRLSGQSHFVLTTPEVTLSSKQDYHLSELNRDESVALLRHEIEHQEAEAGLNSIPDDELGVVYDHLGGHPLALKLVTGQLATTNAFDALVKNLPASSLDTFAMYYQVYENSWALLTAVEREILQTLALSGPGGQDRNSLIGLSGLSDGEVDAAISGLETKQLIQVDEAIYSIHPLTYSFVRAIHAN